MRSLLKLYYKGNQVKELDLQSLDDCHKVIGLLTYGGIQLDNQKLIAESYEVERFEDNVRVIVKLLMTTERELHEKQLDKLAGISPDFARRIQPIFRRNDDGESIN